MRSPAIKSGLQTGNLASPAIKSGLQTGNLAIWGWSQGWSQAWLGLVQGWLGTSHGPVWGGPRAGWGPRSGHLGVVPGPDMAIWGCSQGQILPNFGLWRWSGAKIWPSEACLGWSQGHIWASERAENGKSCVFPGNRVFGPRKGCLGQVPGPDRDPRQAWDHPWTSPRPAPDGSPAIKSGLQTGKWTPRWAI